MLHNTVEWQNYFQLEFMQLQHTIVSFICYASEGLRDYV